MTAGEQDEAGRQAVAEANCRVAAMTPEERAEASRQFLAALHADDDPADAVKRMTERQLVDEIVCLIDARGFRYLRFEYDNRRVRGPRIYSPHIKGYPDLVIHTGCKTMWREVKSEAGRHGFGGMSSAQTEWRHWILGEGGDYGIWCPCDLVSGRIERELDGIDPPSVQPESVRPFHRAMAAPEPDRPRKHPCPGKRPRPQESPGPQDRPEGSDEPVRSSWTPYALQLVASLSQLPDLLRRQP